jgi:hypothetical protein
LNPSCICLAVVAVLVIWPAVGDGPGSVALGGAWSPATMRFGVLKEIEDVDAELCGDFLADLRVLERGEIPRCDARTGVAVPSHVTVEPAGARINERGGVEPLGRASCYDRSAERGIEKQPDGVARGSIVRRVVGADSSKGLSCWKTRSLIGVIVSLPSLSDESSHQTYRRDQSTGTLNQEAVADGDPLRHQARYCNIDRNRHSNRL